MKWNFLYEITAAYRTPDYGATDPHIPVLSPQLNLLNLPGNKIPEYATDFTQHLLDISAGKVQRNILRDFT